MSSFDRRSLILALLAVPACGFTPVYSPAGTLDGAIRVGTPTSGNAFTLVRELERRLGAADAPRYTLEVEVELDEASSVITRSSEIERFTIAGSATYVLRTLDGDRVLGGMARSTTVYSASDTPISTRAARGDAQDRLMVILADQIVARLAAGLS